MILLKRIYLTVTSVAEVKDKHTYKVWGQNGIGPRKVEVCVTNRQANIKLMGS